MHQLPDQKQPATPPAGRGCLAVDALLLMPWMPCCWCLERVTNMTYLRYYSRFFLMPKKTLIYMFRCIKLSRSICDLIQFSRLDHKLREVRSHSKSGLPVHRDAVQHSTIHSGAPTEDASQSPQSVHQHWMTNPNITAHDLHRLLGMLVFLVSLVQRGRLPSSSSTVVGLHSMVPEDREVDRPDHSSSVGAVRGAWWASPAVLQGLPFATNETEVTLFPDVSS